MSEDKKLDINMYHQIQSLIKANKYLMHALSYSNGNVPAQMECKIHDAMKEIKCAKEMIRHYNERIDIFNSW